MHSNIQVGTSLINCVDTSEHCIEAFSENAVSITQLLIAFLNLISIVTHTIVLLLCSVVPINFFKVY